MKNANITPTVELNALAMKRGEATSYMFLENGNSSGNRQGFSGIQGRGGSGNNNGNMNNGGQFNSNQRSGRVNLTNSSLMTA